MKMKKWSHMNNNKKKKLSKSQKVKLTNRKLTKKRIK